jgi:drug/metabolite transporter (DMT)-like permease
VSGEPAAAAPAYRRLVPVLALSLSAALWGSSFFLAKGVVSRNDPLSVLTFRFAIAAVAMWAVRPGSLRRLPRSTWRRAVTLGGFYGFAQVPHYYGLRTVPASTAGFLVGTYVVFTPVLAYLVWRRRSSLATNVGVAATAVGLAVFSWHNPAFGVGALLCLLAAVLYAMQIVAMSAWAVPGQAWAITTIQMATMAAVLGVAAGVQGVDVPSHAHDWLVIAYLALIAGAVGVGIQTWAQTRLAETHAAVIMSGEPLWAAVLAVVFTGEQVTTRLVAGGALLLAANVVVSLSHAGRSRRRSG